nr:MAG TPA: hypothetical protein [Caudoviricetes sp.]
MGYCKDCNVRHIMQMFLKNLMTCCSLNKFNRLKYGISATHVHHKSIITC